MKGERTIDTMVGEPRKHPPAYVFITFTDGVKHLYLGDAPSEWDATACGIPLLADCRWSQRAHAMGRGPYCRDCERIYRESK